MYRKKEFRGGGTACQGFKLIRRCCRSDQAFLKGFRNPSRSKALTLDTATTQVTSTNVAAEFTTYENNDLKGPIGA
jgi:hypothetical protein